MGARDRPEPSKAARTGGEAADTDRSARRRRVVGAAEVRIETVPAPDARTVLGQWSERLARLGRERLRGDQP
jgi:hypothetical protein